MCGIFGCLKKKNSNIDIIKKILTAINLLKNRGYDSCGIYLNNTKTDYINKIRIQKQIPLRTDLALGET